jgi:ABC-2 type transport system ATP-binding protein
VLIAKALSHQPEILFLDEPTAGVDVELRKEMWALVRKLREKGTTIILTTHYIEEAEEMADRVGVINKGKIVLVEEKNELMKKLGKKQVILDLLQPLKTLPPSLEEFNLTLSEDGNHLVYTYDTTANRTGITTVLQALSDNQIKFRDLNTKESSLEEIFVELVQDK